MKTSFGSSTLRGQPSGRRRTRPCGRRQPRPAGL